MGKNKHNENTSFDYRKKDGLKALPLSEVLHKIFIEGKEEYYQDLLHCPDVRRHINVVISNYAAEKNNGYLVNRDYLESLCESVVQEITFRNFKPEWTKHGLDQGYLVMLDKMLAERFWREINKEREDNKEYYKSMDKFRESLEEDDENEVYFQGFRVIGYGNMDDLVQMEHDAININPLLPTYGREFVINDIQNEEDERLEELMDGCTEQQKEVLRYLFKEKYTEAETAEAMGIERISVHGLKDRALKRLRKKLKPQQF